MNICGKGNFPECEYFTTGGCVSPSNCIYKIKQDFYTRATSNEMEISWNAVRRIVAENAELRHRAEVAERQAILLSKYLAEKTRKDYPWQAWFDEAQKQAEKELAEEDKR